MLLRDFNTQSEREYIESVLRRTNWNVTRAAELLDVQRTHLHQRMAALGLMREEKRASRFDSRFRARDANRAWRVQPRRSAFWQLSYDLPCGSLG